MDAGTELLLLWRNLHLADTAVQAALSARLENEAGCSLLEHDLMSWLAAAASGRLRMLDLADMLTVTRSGVTRLMDRLVERGWVTREQPPENRREVYAVLTPEGRDALQRARGAYIRGLDDSLARHLDDQDVADLWRVTRKLLQGLDRWDERRCAPARAGQGERKAVADP